jgi:transketolase N-terminal domain/subunit
MNVHRLRSHSSPNTAVMFVLISYAVVVCIFCVMNSTESCVTIMLSQNASDSLIKSKGHSMLIYYVYLKGI